jgi:hypothetical protein
LSGGEPLAAQFGDEHGEIVGRDQLQLTVAQSRQDVPLERAR